MPLTLTANFVLGKTGNPHRVAPAGRAPKPERSPQAKAVADARLYGGNALRGHCGESLLRFKFCRPDQATPWEGTRTGSMEESGADSPAKPGDRRSSQAARFTLAQANLKLPRVRERRTQ